MIPVDLFGLSDHGCRLPAMDEPQVVEQYCRRLPCFDAQVIQLDTSIYCFFNASFSI